MIDDHSWISIIMYTVYTHLDSPFSGGDSLKMLQETAESLGMTISNTDKIQSDLTHLVIPKGMRTAKAIGAALLGR